MDERVPMPPVPDPWDAHADAQRRAWLKLTYAQRLAWLEQAKRFCSQALGAARANAARPANEPTRPGSGEPGAETT